MSARSKNARAVPIAAAATVLLLAACASKHIDRGSSSLVGSKDGKQDGPVTEGTDGSDFRSDSRKNDDETDVDCGGSSAPKCADGKACLAHSDCASAHCAGELPTCAPARPDDGIKNGGESDVDCGGPVATKCALNAGCAKHEDCESDSCAYNGKCIVDRSCVGHHGGDTCGPVDAQGNCCERLPVPRPAEQGGPYTLDKYVITAGRMRAFVERTRGDIRGYVQSHRPAGFLESWDQYLPVTLDDPKNNINGLNGVYQQLGPWSLVSVGEPELGNRGCNVEGFGARTYRLPDEVNERMGDRQRYPQDALDEKALNCVPYFMLAAFCAWDGGRLPTIAEISYAYSAGDSRLYPWGDEAPAGYGETAYDSADMAPPPPEASRLANYQFNWWSPAERIENDYSVYVAPPGRFPAGTGKFGHADLGGLIIERATDWSAAESAPATGLMSYYWNGSWESHAPQVNVAIPHHPLAKYLAIGGRCAR